MQITQECIVCGTCAESCPADAIFEAEEIYEIADDCTRCGACVGNCPVDAIVDVP